MGPPHNARAIIAQAKLRCRMSAREVVTVRETGLMWANMLRAFQVGSTGRVV